MKKNKIIITIGLIFFCMLLLNKRPFLVQALTPNEMLGLALEKTLNNKSFLYHGSVYIMTNDVEDGKVQTNTNLQGVKRPLETFEITIKGKKDKAKQHADFKLSSDHDQEDVLLFSYYEDRDARYLETPLKSYQKLVFPKERLELNHNKEYIAGLKKLKQINVCDAFTTINQNTVYEIKIPAKQYKIKLDTSQWIGLLSQNQELAEDQFKKSESLQLLVKKLGIENLELKLFVDEAFYIRKMEANLKGTRQKITLEIYLDDYNKKQNITLPNFTDAITIKEPLSIWMLRGLE